jgi:hypothetical protein
MINMTLDTLVGITACTLGAVSLTLGMILLRETRRWRARIAALEAQLPAQRRELELIASVIAHTGRQLKRMDGNHAELSKRVELTQERAPAKSLGGAIGSARHGADAEKLSRQFGLSRGEAELVTRLHGQKQSA